LRSPSLSTYIVRVTEREYSQIFQPTDTLTEQTALDALRGFLHVLQQNSTPTNGMGDGADLLVQTICNDCIEAIGEPEKAQAKAGMKVLCTFVGTSRASTLASRGVVC
jgi:DNA repair/transcription protein MET18/MMS19